MITPEEYLRARGWRADGRVEPGGGNRWYDPMHWAAVPLPTAEAARTQVLRDEACNAFQRSRMAKMVLEECARRNAEAKGLAKAKG